MKAVMYQANRDQTVGQYCVQGYICIFSTRMYLHSFQTIKKKKFTKLLGFAYLVCTQSLELLTVTHTVLSPQADNQYYSHDHVILLEGNKNFSTYLQSLET